MRTRLADPNYEPTDDELRELSRSAFAHVGERHRAALARMWDEISAMREADQAKMDPKS